MKGNSKTCNSEIQIFNEIQRQKAESKVTLDQSGEEITSRNVRFYCGQLNFERTG